MHLFAILEYLLFTLIREEKKISEHWDKFVLKTTEVISLL